MVAIFGAHTASAGFTIDAFTSPDAGQIAIDDTVGGTVVTSNPGLPVLGSIREIFVSKTGQIGMGDQPVKASANEKGTQIFNFDQFSSTARGVAQLVYDGVADGAVTPQGLSVGVDLTASGTNLFFMFQNMKVTGSGLLLTVNLFNDANGGIFSSGPIALVNGFNGDLMLSFASFTGAGGVGTLTNVGAIEIIVDGSADAASGSDLTFDLFSSGTPGPPFNPPSVPEPTSLALLGCGLLFTGGYGFRRRRSSTPAA